VTGASRGIGAATARRLAADMHASAGEPHRLERLRSRIPLGRGGEPEEVAAAVAWLLSPDASYTTGAFIDVAGGR
jgi:NAD(P)-dependent dehydrogenase (short-subunit alcohol dehydrogenase family)